MADVKKEKRNMFLREKVDLISELAVLGKESKHL
jgi:hypothetical protein